MKQNGNGPTHGHEGSFLVGTVRSDWHASEYQDATRLRPSFFA